MADTFIDPVVQALIAIAPPGIDRHYATAPDGPPEDNSVIYPLVGFEIVDQSSGKLTYRMTFRITHIFRRSNLADNIAGIQAVIPGWIDALTAYPNQRLSGNAVNVNLIKGDIVSVPWGGQNSIGLVLTTTIDSEQFIRLS